MNIFLKKLSADYADDLILLVVDSASWRQSANLEIPQNIELFFLPPAAPVLLSAGQSGNVCHASALTRAVILLAPLAVLSA
jgi:hypothetical protein